MGFIRRLQIDARQIASVLGSLEQEIVAVAFFLSGDSGRIFKTLLYTWLSRRCVFDQTGCSDQRSCETSVLDLCGRCIRSYAQ